ncbi:MAG: Tet(A)/Tet(B)/Tet(C) family tetracycline efflux MFS transporter [Devosia sp.]|uniref:Tet(A)/Tet(B)/Tet(C) family tetracycline efflux MFS transporter n=1 Tax=Devosia sp. 66-22 TaxID=1895753 RepID=UPI000B1A10F6|nr:Tet(A)/Tet(B)/Tet(C) family tetracycline efflux MFS transporter [Devosia sp. 66-22]MBN9346081.1 Tet(A)/Tet(B)/Tet(C) family tetracycline efflux MFS transporter [Devosia sp.]
MNRPLIIILAAVMLDSIGIGLIFPILPKLLEEVTHVANIAPYVGVMFALYAAIQFIFSPVLGVLSDRFGRRPVLLISLAGAAVDYLFMAFAPELWMLVLGRAIAGFTSANMAVATAYITDITPEEQRAQRFGLFHAMFGIGFVIGPVLGGLLGDVWVRAPFIAAAVLNGLNFALALFMLPESRPGRRDTRFDLKALNPLVPLAWAFTLKGLVPLLLVFFILNFVGNMYGTVWALYGYDAFQWNGLMVGISLAGYGIFHAIVQAVLPGPASKRFGERNALLIGLACECAGLLLMGFATQGWVVFAALPLFALGGIGIPAFQSLATRQADADKQGQLQGVMASIVSLASIFGPLYFAGFYFGIKDWWPGLIWIIGVGTYLLAIPLILAMRTRAAAPAPA